jgi:hypothetical protein
MMQDQQQVVDLEVVVREVVQQLLQVDLEQQVKEIMVETEFLQDLIHLVVVVVLAVLDKMVQDQLTVMEELVFHL